jgi:hypothetical protein
VTALTVVSGLGTVGALSASAATPSCGHRCVDIFSREFGTHRHPNYVLDVWRQTARAGAPISQAPAPPVVGAGARMFPR